MELLALLGRVFFAVMFVSSGIAHITKRQYMSEYARSMRVPNSMVVVVASGAMILAGGIMVLLGIWGDLGALLIAAFLIPTAIVMHGFWRLEDEGQRQQQQTHFMKNLTMAGGAFAIAALFICAEGGAALTGPLFG